MEQEQEKKIEELYVKYKKILNPLIVNYEVSFGEFPIEILNEIRSITTHLSKIYADNLSKEDIDVHIKKAHNHLKRAILDGFKYMCMFYQEESIDFKKEYKSVLALIDNGNFIEDYHKQENIAEDAYLDAKKIEIESEDVEASYDAFEKAFNAYINLHSLMEDKLDNTKKISEVVVANQMKKYKISVIANIILGAATIASLIVSIVK